MSKLSSFRVYLLYVRAQIALHTSSLFLRFMFSPFVRIRSSFCSSSFYLFYSLLLVEFEWISWCTFCRVRQTTSVRTYGTYMATAVATSCMYYARENMHSETRHDRGGECTLIEQHSSAPHRIHILTCELREASLHVIVHNFQIQNRLNHSF